MDALTEMEFNGLITKDEFLKVVKLVGNNEEEVAKVVKWIVAKRSEAEVVNLMLQGFFEFSGWDGDDPILVPSDELIEDFLADEPTNVSLSAPKSEGNYVQNF